MNTIQVEALHQKLSSSQITPAQIIDVRTPAEYRERNIEGSTLLPLDELNADKIHGVVENQPIYLLCKSGARSAKAKAKLAGQNLADTVIIDGGIDAWAAAGLPLNHGKSTMSLERQVRIAAGSLVVFGSLLGLLVHPYWLGIPLFVGSGLAFAGLTDTCGMGMMLAKMPWNRIS
ncbi:rhodanese-like domain-containing protein [Luteolibacter algae]|uniref:Rhodanese-like domain-containing protein n=1 Tax=Luteolibacter algae TaxID=454151 RepID=A0ABW5D4G5_9BACT